MDMKNITAPFDKETVRSLHAGDTVRITGTIYTARDAAHKRICEAIAAGTPLPFDLAGAVIYYVGPTPPRPGQVIGAAGPTTSGRMDAYAPTLMAEGLSGMIGKGERLPSVIEAMKAHTAVYLAATGGAGALLSHCIKQSEVIAYEDLGTEAVRRLYVEDFPATVVIDCYGENLYRTAPEKYRR
ncbi:MAG: Fe-S-containing hydro-lyase [Firmicutes bacterium]|nr:Fe-S-containing hydro-lyase [Bacillota bacterium]